MPTKTKNKKKPTRRVARPKPKPKAKAKKRAKPKRTARRRAPSRVVGERAAARGRSSATAPEPTPDPTPSAPTLTATSLSGTGLASVIAAAGLPVLATAAVVPPPEPMPPGVKVLQHQPWKNYGTNLQTTVAKVYQVTNDPPLDPESGMRALRWAVRDLARTGGGGSASGARWSFSPVALNTQATFDVQGLALQLGLTADLLHDPADVSRLVHVQAGTQVDQVIRYAASAGMALKAMGGNCGQTIAGAVSTGTHGGFTDHPGFPDMVRALYLVGEDGKRHWLERASRRALNDATLAKWQQMGVEVHVDDDALFDHAAVSLGTFGVIYSLILETTRAYGVQLQRLPLPFDEPLERATFDRTFAGPVPMDFATVVNPFALSKQNGRWLGPDGSAVRTWLERVAPNTPMEPPHADAAQPLNDAALAPLLAGLANAIPAVVKPLVKLLLGELYKTRIAQGPMSVAYPLSLTHSPTLGMEVGVPTNRSREAFDVIVTYLQGAPRALPGVLAMRTTLQSKATLSLARWSTTTCIEFCCLLVPQTEQVLTGALDALEAAGIPFALHLGMLHGTVSGQSWLTPARFRAMFGPQAVDDFVAARKVISPKGTVFTNPLTRSLGLTS